MNRTAMAGILAGALVVANARATVVAEDDAGRTITLRRPAARIISLSPHVTELLFAAGGGNRVVGVMVHSDYPEQARSLPLVGASNGIDIERVIALRPDLVVAWQGGNGSRQLEQLSRLGIPVFFSEPKRLEQVATSLHRLGRLMGTEAVAGDAARRYRDALAALARRYGAARPVDVFYQAWDKPLYTLSGSHIASDAIRLCGGRNVFADLGGPAPQVGVEAVLLRDPAAIVGSARYGQSREGLAMWQRHRSLKAVRLGNLITLDGDLLTRATPRIAEGARALCEALDGARVRETAALKR